MEVATEQAPPRIYASCGGFDFEEIMTCGQCEGIVGAESAEAFGLVCNYRCNMKKLRDADMPAQTKADIVVLSKQAMIEKFIELGVPKHLAWHFFNFAAGTVSDGGYA